MFESVNFSLLYQQKTSIFAHFTFVMQINNFNQEEFFQPENGIRKVSKIPFQMTHSYLDLINFYPQNLQKTAVFTIFRQFLLYNFLTNEIFFKFEKKIIKKFMKRDY